TLFLVNAKDNSHYLSAFPFPGKYVREKGGIKYKAYAMIEFTVLSWLRKYFAPINTYETIS
ncbi:MAG: hypothetical protein KAI44_09100, partial [Methylococcales bacterium]|nr:hypothetical protein [Methylococcales bacterium]